MAKNNHFYRSTRLSTKSSSENPSLKLLTPNVSSALLRTNAPTGRGDRKLGQFRREGLIAQVFVSGGARASPTLPGADGSPGWLSPPHLTLTGVGSGQHAQALVVTAACAAVATGAMS